MKQDLHVTFQNTIPENTLRLTKNSFTKFNNMIDEIFISKEIFLKDYAIRIQEVIRSKSEKIKSFQDVLNILDQIFMVYFHEVINFPIKYQNKTYLINWNKIHRCLSSSTQIRYTEVETVCKEIPNDQCCKNTCIAFEIAIWLWDRAHTSLKKIEINQLKQMEFYLIDHFKEFNRFPVTSEHYLFEHGCLKPLYDKYDEDSLSELLDIRTNGCVGNGIFLMCHYDIPTLNKTICIWAPMKISEEINPCSEICSLDRMVIHNNEIKATLLVDVDYKKDDLDSEDNYIIYLRLIMGISEDYKINP